jgi:hypothetical protein
MRSKAKTQRLSMLLKKPPRWWPTDAQGKPVWVGVLAGAVGWAVGEGDPMTPRQIRDVKQIMLMDNPGARFEVKE